MGGGGGGLVERDATDVAFQNTILIYSSHAVFFRIKTERCARPASGENVEREFRRERNLAFYCPGTQHVATSHLRRNSGT